MENLINSSQQKDSKLIAQLNRVVCICKGIRLGHVLRNMQHCTTVEEVNKKAGTGCGGCKGERCGPRIEKLLKKQKEKNQS